MTLISSLRKTDFYNRHQKGFHLTAGWCLVVIVTLWIAHALWRACLAHASHNGHAISPIDILLIAVVSSVVFSLLYCALITPFYLFRGNRNG